MTNEELIRRATSVLRRHTSGDRLFGDVAAAIISESGNVYVGVCVDTPSWGLCAERSAIAAMVTDGEYRVSKVVAVWRDDSDGKLYVLPPCGICRQFMRDVDEQNLEADVVLGNDKHVKLKELLPYNAWPQPLD